MSRITVAIKKETDISDQQHILDSIAAFINKAEFRHDIEKVFLTLKVDKELKKASASKQ